jgi:hypothetical protein
MGDGGNRWGHGNARSGDRQDYPKIGKISYYFCMQWQYFLPL